MGPVRAWSPGRTSVGRLVRTWGRRGRPRWPGLPRRPLRLGPTGTMGRCRRGARCGPGGVWWGCPAGRPRPERPRRRDGPARRSGAEQGRVPADADVAVEKQRCAPPAFTGKGHEHGPPEHGRASLERFGHGVGGRVDPQSETALGGEEGGHPAGAAADVEDRIGEPVEECGLMGIGLPAPAIDLERHGGPVDPSQDGHRRHRSWAARAAPGRGVRAWGQVSMRPGDGSQRRGECRPPGRRRQRRRPPRSPRHAAGEGG